LKMRQTPQRPVHALLARIDGLVSVIF
jgi:hypothetical protein